jgi:hypothetical protein
MLESVAEIGNMVGVHVELTHHTSQVKTKKAVAKQSFKQVERKPASKMMKKEERPQAPRSPRARPSNDDVFPLDDSDLKEF